MIPVTRGGRLLETFAGLADALVAGYDVVDLLQHLVETCRDLLDTTAAAILLVDDHGDLDRSISAIRMRLRDTTIGTLNLLRDLTGELPAQDLVAAQAFADVATIGILQAWSRTPARFRWMRHSPSSATMHESID